METRQITQVKIHKLVLNPMQDHTEAGNMVALSYERDKLIEWYKAQFAPEPWTDRGLNSFPAKGDFGGQHNTDHAYHKVFSKGSPIEWYNACGEDFIPQHFGHGIHEEWTTQEMLDNFLNRTLLTGVQFIQ